MADAFVYWLLPLSWGVHDLEELVTLPAWRAEATPKLAALARRSPLARRWVETLPRSRRQFAVAAGLVGLVVVGAAGAGGSSSRLGLLVFSVVLGGYVLHGVVHVFQAAAFGGYVPGVVTAVVVVLPTGGYLYWWLLTGGRLTPTVAVLTAVAGLVVFVPLVVVAGNLAAFVVAAPNEEFRTP